MTTRLGLAPRGSVDELRLRIEQLEARIAAVESGPRDVQDAVLMSAIAATIGSASFTARELWRHREYAPALASALRDADLSTPSEIGCWCRALGDRVIEGRRLARGTRSGAGRHWRLVLMVLMTSTP